MVAISTYQSDSANELVGSERRGNQYATLNVGLSSGLVFLWS
jgi:hypothetical protein